MESDSSAQFTRSRIRMRAGPATVGWAIGGLALSIFVVLAIMAIVSGPTISSTGVFINVVDPGSPADDAGVVAGEVIIEINGEKMVSAQAMQEVIFDNLGQPMVWTLRHADTIVTREVTPRANPAAGQRAAGIFMQDFNQTEGRREQVTGLLPVAYAGIGVLVVTQLFAMWRRRSKPVPGQLGTS